MRYKCNECFTIVDEQPCPVCGYDNPLPMCELDHVCTCTFERSEGLNYCPKCGAATCKCGAHDVLQISRVTGYMQDVSGWNAGKQQELKDRQRYILQDGQWTKRGGI